MINKTQANKLKRAIRLLVQAEIEASWRGVGDSGSLAAIKAEQRAAQLKVDLILAQLTEKN